MGQEPGISLLAALTAAERSRILQRLLDDHPDLHDEAAALAREELTTVDPDAVTSQIVDAFLDIDFQAIAPRVGHRRGYGYIDATQATIELLSETLEPFVSEITRRTTLGFDQAARTYARGVTAGLVELRDTAGEDTLIGWGRTEQNTAELAWEVTHALEESGIDPQDALGDLWHHHPL